MVINKTIIINSRIKSEIIQDIGKTLIKKMRATKGPK